MTTQILYTPRQPLMVLAAGTYYKMEIQKYGISHFYRFHADQVISGMAQVVPDGVVDIIFRCSKDVPEAVCYGTPLHCQTLSETSIVHPGDEIFGVRFLPGQCWISESLSMAELTDGFADLKELLRDSGLIEQICTQESFARQVDLFLNYYKKKYCRRQLMGCDQKLEQYLLKRILSSGGTVKVATLSQETFFSERYINKIFHDAYGVSPKTYDKMIRFQNVLTAIRTQGKLVDLACETGYYDQAHLNREFKSMLGITPKKYRRELKETGFEQRLIILPNIEQGG